MSVDISAALEGGYERTVAPTGLQFAVIFYVISLLSALFSVDAEPVPTDSIPGGDVAPGAGGVPAGPSLGLPPGVAGVVSLLLGIVSLVVTIAAIRTFVAGETETIPREFARRDIAWTGVNFVVGGVVFGIAVAIGFVLLVIPGLFLLVSLFFWTVFVAVEDENFVEGLQSSWELTGGHRLVLFALGVVVAVVGFVVSLVFGIPAFFLPDVLGFLLNEVGSALLTVFFLATAAEAYIQLVAGDEAEQATAETAP